MTIGSKQMNLYVDAHLNSGLRIMVPRLRLCVTEEILTSSVTHELHIELAQPRNDNKNSQDLATFVSTH